MKSFTFVLMTILVLFIVQIPDIFAEEENGLFLNPITIAVDSKGFVYVVDNDNNNVQKFDSDGKFVSKWISKNDFDSMFSQPYGIAIDSNDNVYVVSQGHGKIKKLLDSGYIAHSFGKLGYQDEDFKYPNGEFGKPTHIAIDSNDNVYVIDYGANTIQKFTSDGVFLSKWGSEGTKNGQFSTMLGIATDSIDNVYILDEGRIDNESYFRVQKFTSDGVFLSKWGEYGSGDGKFLSASGITLDSSDIVYITDFRGQFLQKFSSDGKFIEKLPIFSTDSDRYSGVSSVAIDKMTDNFYITNSIDKHISKFSSDGALLAKWGGIASWDHLINDIEPETTPQEVPGDRDGLYNDKGLLVNLLEKNQTVNAVFYFDLLSLQENTKAVAKYSLLTQNEQTILKSEESKTVTLNSKESEKPIIFHFSWPQNGSFILQQSVEYTDSSGNVSVPYGNSEHIFIVDNVGKAINDKGSCKNDSLIPVIKSDFSKVACVSYQTSLVLYHRGW